MTIRYQQLSSGERATIATLLAEGRRESDIARALSRDRSCINRELERNGCRLDHATGRRQPYDAVAAQKRADRLATQPRAKKLEKYPMLLDLVREKIRACWSPEQIAGQLKTEHPDAPEKRVCHETIYDAIYVMAKGDLKTELVACLRQRNGKRRPRSRGKDRGKIAAMTSIHVRPPEVADRVVPGHWEGDLIKGKRNASSVGTLVERTSRLVLLVRLADATADSVLVAFTQAMEKVDGSMKKTLTYDQGREMARHLDFTAATGLKVYFADPHSPWQRGSNENTNGLVRQYLPKGMDLSRVTQQELDMIALMLNTRPRKMHGFKTPLEVFEAKRCAPQK